LSFKLSPKVFFDRSFLLRHWMASADFRQIRAAALNLLTGKILQLSKKFATEFAHERGDPE
jgi:ATP-dependent exoDNAse (exonuclease V) alpha subunit